MAMVTPAWVRSRTAEPKIPNTIRCTEFFVWVGIERAEAKQAAQSAAQESVAGVTVSLLRSPGRYKIALSLRSIDTFRALHYSQINMSFQLTRTR